MPRHGRYLNISPKKREKELEGQRRKEKGKGGHTRLLEVTLSQAPKMKSPPDRDIRLLPYYSVIVHRDMSKTTDARLRVLEMLPAPGVTQPIVFSF